MMQIEAPDVLLEHVSKVIEQIDTDDLEDDLTRQFIEHHVLSLSLKAEAYKDMILRGTLTKEDEIKHKKHLSVYQNISEILAGKLNTRSTGDLHKMLVLSQSLLENSANE